MLSDDDIAVAQDGLSNPPTLIRSTWSKDPVKAAILRAISSCQARVGHGRVFGWDMADALAQKSVWLLHS